MNSNKFKLQWTGYGLCAIVEVLTGISAAANFATKIRKWSLDGSSSAEANLGQVFIAVDPKCFAPDFEGRLTELNDILRNLPTVTSAVFHLFSYKIIITLTLLTLTH